MSANTRPEAAAPPHSASESLRRAGSPAVAAAQVRHLGRLPYEPVWRDMQELTDRRDCETRDEIWVLEHDPVFTQGQAGRAEHVLAPGDIPLVQVDRGGQVTYHGPGQLVVYPLLDLRRLGLGVRALVHGIEAAVIDTLAEFNIDAARRDGAPGVYVGERKIAQLGLRVRRGCSFHGLAFNVDMDLEPFQRINPCGFAGLEVTQVSDFHASVTLDAISSRLLPLLAGHLGIGLEGSVTPVRQEST